MSRSGPEFLADRSSTAQPSCHAAPAAPALAEFDVVVIGGGPAGAAAGRLLAAWGHSVLVLTKAIDEARGLAESLPPSTRKLLAAVGVLEAVEAAGFYRTTGNTVWWGSDDGRVETFRQAGEAAGYQVFRPALDRLLLAQAETAGARVLIGASVKQVQADEARRDVAASEFEHDGQAVSSSARFVLDCSGRAGVIARQGYRRYETGHRMQALIGIWERSSAPNDERGWDLPDETQTVVETYEDGWAWSVPVSPVDAARRRHGQRGDDEADARAGDRGGVQVRAGEDASARRADADGRRKPAARVGLRCILVFGAQLRRCLAAIAARRRRRRVHRSAVVVRREESARLGVDRGGGGPHVTPRRRPQADRARLLLVVGASGLRHAPAADVRLRPSRLRAASVGVLGRTRGSSSRRTAASDEAVNRRGLTIEQTLMRDPGVQNAFRCVQGEPSLQLAWADAIRFEKRPLIRDREIVLEDAVPLPAARTCLRYLGGVDLLKLGEMACQHRQVPDLYEAYCRTQMPVSLPHLLGGLSLLVANGVLTHRAR